MYSTIILLCDHSCEEYMTIIIIFKLENTTSIYYLEDH